MQQSTGLIQPTRERRRALPAYIAADHGELGHWAVTSAGSTAGWISLTPLSGNHTHTGRVPIGTYPLGQGLGDRRTPAGLRLREKPFASKRAGRCRLAR